MKRKPANSKGHKKSFSRSASKTHKRNLYVPRGGYRL